MPSRTLLSGVLGLTALLPLAGAANTPDLLTGLLARSPFGSTATNPASTIAVNQPLEFRAVLEEQGTQIFSIYDTATRRSTWVNLNYLTDGLRIEAYDDVHECIMVLYQGKTLRLSLTGAWPKVRTVQVKLPQKSKAPEANEYHDKPFRIGHVAEEMEIRRLMRQSAATPENSPATSSVENKLHPPMENFPAATP